MWVCDKEVTPSLLYSIVHKKKLVMMIAGKFKRDSGKVTITH